MEPRTYLQSKYQFRYNVVNDVIECIALQSPHKSEILDERLLDRLWLEVNEGEGGRCSVARLKRLINGSLAVPYDPFLKYLEDLPSWTIGMPDYLEQLAGTIKTGETTTFLNYLRKWLVAMVGSLFSEEVVNHTALILSGPQGIGKTRWFNALIPPLLQPYYYLGPLPAGPELDMLLSSCFLINLDELAGCTARKFNQLKEVITRGHVNRRIPYQRYYQRVPRRATFAGTANGSEFLHDDTGNRRFLVVEAQEIDVEHGVDIDMLFAQALHLYLTGEQHWFDAEEVVAINKMNVNYQRCTLEEEALLTVFEPADEQNYTDFAPTTDILRKLVAHPAGFKISESNSCKKALGSALRKHEFMRVKRKGRYSYLLKLKA